MRVERIDLQPKSQKDSKTVVQEDKAASGADKKMDWFRFLRLAHMKKSLFKETKSINKEEKFKLDIYKLFIEIFSRENTLILKDFIDNLEKSIILNVLDKVNGHQKEAGRILGIKYTTLNEKIKKYNIRFKKSPSLPPL